MGIFSKGPSVRESFSYAIEAFGSGILKLDEGARKSVSPVAVGAIKQYIANQSYSEQEKNATLTLFLIVSGTVGVTPSPQLITDGKAGEVSETIESLLPFNMPMVVMGPIRMVIEEYVTGQSMGDIDYEKFDKSEARQLVHALMTAVDIVNTRCIQQPKKHTQNEVMCLAHLVAVVAQYAKVQLSQVG
jgi:hypothetical protein